jgi:hypothetical protein
MINDLTALFEPGKLAFYPVVILKGEQALGDGVKPPQPSITIDSNAAKNLTKYLEKNRFN